ncbi:MAG: sugar phosphate isomerase/epimerase [Planctomycetaceae bacterium]|nr:sugar phosphate isomerase/epimerase [Planctomycetaceae bacterium]
MELDFGDFEAGFPLANERVQKLYLEYGEQYGVAFPSIALNAFAKNGMSRPRDSGKGLAAVAAIKACVTAAAAMGIPVVQAPSFDDGRIDSEEAFRNTAEKLRLACRLAADHGIIIASENILSADETERLAAEVDQPNFRIMYDTQNYYLNNGYHQADLLRRIHPLVVQVHIKDGYNGTISSALLGEGENGFMETAGVIKETYRGDWLLLENYYHIRPLSDLDPDPFRLLARDIEKARAIFPIMP